MDAEARPRLLVFFFVVVVVVVEMNISFQVDARSAPRAFGVIHAGRVFYIWPSERKATREREKKEDVFLRRPHS